MLQNSTDNFYTKQNIGLQEYQYLLSNNTIKHNEFYEDLLKIKDRLVPNMKHVMHNDMERMKMNKVYDRKLSRDLNGPKGLTWQCKQELQRLRSDERSIERDLIRLNRDLAKVSSLPPINRSPSLSRNQNSRLSSIAEEKTIPPIDERPKFTPGSSSTFKSNRTSITRLVPIKTRSLLIQKSDQFIPSSKSSIQQLIAKTSDDRPYLQRHVYTIEQQRRSIEQKLKQFLH